MVNILEGLDSDPIAILNTDSIKRALKEVANISNVDNAEVTLNTAHRNLKTGNPHLVKAEEVTIRDNSRLIVATEVEGALQENRTAIDLNTAKNTNEQAFNLSAVLGTL